MNVKMNESGGLDVTDISMEQIALLAKALKESSEQDFMQDPELSKLFKLLSIMQSEVFDQMKSGEFDFSQFKKQ